MVTSKMTATKPHKTQLPHSDWLQPEALEQHRLALLSCILIVEDDVRPPDELRGDADGRDVVVFFWIPSEFVIIPFLS